MQVDPTMGEAVLPCFRILDRFVMIAAHVKQRHIQRIIDVFKIIIGQVAASKDQTDIRKSAADLWTVDKRNLCIA